jgi:pilus assembly protein CpaF
MPDPASTPLTQLQPLEAARLKAYLISTVSRELEARSFTLADQRQEVTQWIADAYERTRLQLAEEQRKHILTEVFNEVAGYGPIQPLLDDLTISEVMVLGARQVYIERDGTLRDTGITFEDDDHVLRIINRMVHPLGRRVDPDNPMVDARLPDGSRINVVIPPVSIDGPCITIRKFLPSKLTMAQLIAMGSLTDHMAEFLRACVVARLNVLITGNTSSGKTTLLNVLTSFIPNEERILTIEDAAELQLHQRYIVRLETKSPSVDGTGAVTTRDLVRNSLRMRPDRIIVGEVRGGEALDMLQAMNTGHDGSLTTLHANSPRDAIARLETMALMAGLEMPLLALRKQIAAAIDLIVHQSRLPDGARKTTQITEVERMEGEVVTLTDIFKFEQTGINPEGKILGQMKPTGIRPHFSTKLEAAGFKLPGDIFGAGSYARSN